MKTICIYHSHCLDGFAAAWVVRKYHNDILISRYWQIGSDIVRLPFIEFFAASYGYPPPDVRGKSVIMVDFSYPRNVMEKIAEEALSLTVFDHHKSAEEALREFSHPNARVVFDMNRSGAGIAWDELIGGARPTWINFVEDRDLWKFKYETTRPFCAALHSYEMNFESWDAALASNFLIAEGSAILRAHDKSVAEFVRGCKSTTELGGVVVSVLNVPPQFSSDCGHALAQGKPFSATYWDKNGERLWSLRSTDEGVDVSEIAKLYGGGGHRNAAGFKTKIGPVVI